MKGQGIARWFVRNLDVLAFGTALASVGPLMFWWSVLVRRNIVEMDRLAREHLATLPDLNDRTQQLLELEGHTQRQLFMISGETTLAGVLLAVLAMVLFMVARHRRAEHRRLQTLLQLTSHQLKTPIAGLRMLLQTLGAGAVPAELNAQMLQRGVLECDRLEHLVETILAFQRTVVRAARNETIATDELVGGILSHRKHLTEVEEATWAVRAPTWVQCDPDAVRVVLENVLDNARKYGGGKVTLSERSVDGRWRLEVSDLGQGFEPSHAERLFEPFERAEGTGAAHGSGLGLYISRQLARKMRGNLTASSPGRGQGARFVLDLPLAKPRQEARQQVVHE